jgi:uncharacterized protein
MRCGPTATNCGGKSSFGPTVPLSDPMNQAALMEVLRTYDAALHENRATGLFMFGSRALGMSRPDSDLDLFIDYDPESKVPNMFRLIQIEEELSRALGVRTETLLGKVSLLKKTVNYRKSLRIFPSDRRTVGRHDHHFICSPFHAFVPLAQPSVAGTRACRLAASADRLAAATPSPPPASFRRSAPMGVPLPSVAARPRQLGTRQAGDGGQMASRGLSDLLAVAITSRTPQNQRRNPGPDPSDEPRQSALGCTSHPRRTAHRHRGEPGYWAGTSLGAVTLPPRLGAASCGTI